MSAVKVEYRSKRTEMGRICNTYGREKWCVRGLVGKSAGRRPLGKPRRRWKDNIKMDIREVGWGKDCLEMAPGRDRWRAFVNAVKTLRIS